MHVNYKWKKEARLKRKNIKVQQKSTSFSTIFLLVCVQYMYTFLFSWVIIYIIELHARNEDDPWNLQRKMTIHGFDFLNVRPSPPPEKKSGSALYNAKKSNYYKRYWCIIYKLMHENLHSYAAKRLLGKECISFPTPVDSVFILRRGQKMQSWVCRPYF